MTGWRVNCILHVYMLWVVASRNWTLETTTKSMTSKYKCHTEATNKQEIPLSHSFRTHSFGCCVVLVLHYRTTVCLIYWSMQVLYMNKGNRYRNMSGKIIFPRWHWFSFSFFFLCCCCLCNLHRTSIPWDLCEHKINTLFKCYLTFSFPPVVTCYWWMWFQITSHILDFLVLCWLFLWAVLP